MFCVWPVHILKTIHKFLRKAVYRFPISACPYTNRQIRGLFLGPGPSKMCMKRKELAIHTQRVTCLLRNMPAAFTQRAPGHYKARVLFCPGSASAGRRGLLDPFGQLQSGATGWQTP